MLDRGDDGVHIEREIDTAGHLDHARGVQAAVEGIHAEGGRAVDNSITRREQYAHDQVDQLVGAGLVDALDESLAMPEPGDSIRAVATRTARDLGLELKVAYEVRSISAMKSLVARGAASSILPYFAVIDEVKAGTLAARRIVMPALRRTLFLASSKQRGPFRNEAGLTGAVRASLQGLLDELGPLAQPLWVRTA